MGWTACNGIFNVMWAGIAAMDASGLQIAHTALCYQALSARYIFNPPAYDS